jgi:hypothetical protein
MTIGSSTSLGWRHDGNRGNELTDHLAKEAACSSEADIAYIKILISAEISKLK